MCLSVPCLSVCARGNFLSGTTCTPCPVDTYLDTPGTATSCTPCNVQGRTRTISTGSDDIMDCSTCLQHYLCVCVCVCVCMWVWLTMCVFMRMRACVYLPVSCSVCVKCCSVLQSVVRDITWTWPTAMPAPLVHREPTTRSTGPPLSSRACSAPTPLNAAQPTRR